MSPNTKYTAQHEKQLAALDRAVQNRQNASAPPIPAAKLARIPFVGPAKLPPRKK